MEWGEIAVQVANGLSFGFLLFILTAGLQVIFGLMGVVNIAHGSYMSEMCDLSQSRSPL